MFATELDAKRLEFLLEAVPRARNIAVLNPGRGWSLAHLREVAETRRLQLVVSDLPGPDGYGSTFTAMSKAKVDAVLVPSLPRFYFEHLLIIEAAAQRRIPAMYEWGEIARAGGLIAYGPVLADLLRRSALYVDKILKGAKPGDLPVERNSSRFPVWPVSGFSLHRGDIPTRRCNDGHCDSAAPLHSSATRPR